MNIIKRNGEEVIFDSSKIRDAIMKANKDTKEEDHIDLINANLITDEIVKKCEKIQHTVNVEEVQDMVELCLMQHGYLVLAKEYITYRFKRALQRKSNSTDEQILSIVNLSSEEIKQENSNKNPIINSTQRDYIAGETSKDLTKRLLLPRHIWKAHEEGLIHFHDADYFLQKMHNCCLVDSESVLNEGTVISRTGIDTPKSFQTACTVLTQVVAQVASQQYGL